MEDVSSKMEEVFGVDLLFALVFIQKELNKQTIKQSARKNSRKETHSILK